MNTHPYSNTPILGALGGLFRSRKFLLLLMDAILAIVLNYTGVDRELILILQPVLIAVILGIAHEDGQKSVAAGMALQTPIQLVTVVGEKTQDGSGFSGGSSPIN